MELYNFISAQTPVSIGYGVEDNTVAVMVDKDRYTGIYSGSLYTAWILDTRVNKDQNVKPYWSFGIPPAAGSNDTRCGYFWSSLRSDKEIEKYYVHGVGDTPIEALQSLEARMVSIKGDWDISSVGLINVPNVGSYYDNYFIVDIRNCHGGPNEIYEHIRLIIEFNHDVW